MVEDNGPSDNEQKIIIRAKKRFKYCVDWEAEARVRFDFDYKFANGDTHNKYQWDDEILKNRELEERPCLTINKTQQHNLAIINDARQNKPGVRIRPVGDDASFEAASVFQELIYHIEYQSNAENIYDRAMQWQVEAGIGYWRITTDYISNKSFDQEIYLKPIKDPRSVYLDPDIVEQDGTDSRYGFIFEDIPKDLYKEKHPKFPDVGGNTVLGSDLGDGWVTKDLVRICEYFEKEQEEDKLVTWISPNDGTQVLSLLSELDDEFQKALYKELKKDKQAQALYQFKERKVLTDNIKWYKIAGDRIIEENNWLGKYIPIIRCVGIETVIDGILDRKGHTRALINAQQIYNYNTSANVEYGALQTKSPWLAPQDAIENFEEYWKTANSANHSYLPYNHIGEDGNPIPPPSRPAAPQPAPAYVEQLKISQNEMMMVSGQYQAQLGENENAKSGVAINARARQGDRATFHFLDNQSLAIRNTGKQLLDLIPKVYDTKRVKRIRATDGDILNITIDPNAAQDYQKVAKDQDKEQQMDQIIFNPNVGIYDVQSDTGPSFATKRIEASQALTELAKADKGFMQIGGDIYFEMLDFPKADVLAERYKKIIPAAITGDGPDPQVEQAMHQAADKIEQQQALITQQAKEIADKSKEHELKVQDMQRKEHELELEFRKAKVDAVRKDYEAETKLLTALGNSGPAISIEQIQPIVAKLIREILGTNLEEDTNTENNEVNEAQTPPIEGAKKAPDGQWYVEDNGQYYQVGQQQQAQASEPAAPSVPSEPQVANAGQ